MTLTVLNAKANSGNSSLEKVAITAVSVGVELLYQCEVETTDVSKIT